MGNEMAKDISEEKYIAGFIYAISDNSIYKPIKGAFLKNKKDNNFYVRIENVIYSKKGDIKITLERVISEHEIATFDYENSNKQTNNKLYNYDDFVHSEVLLFNCYTLQESKTFPSLVELYDFSNNVFYANKLQLELTTENKKQIENFYITRKIVNFDVFISDNIQENTVRLNYFYEKIRKLELDVTRENNVYVNIYQSSEFKAFYELAQNIILEEYNVLGLKISSNRLEEIARDYAIKYIGKRIKRFKDSGSYNFSDSDINNEQDFDDFMEI